MTGKNLLRIPIKQSQGIKRRETKEEEIKKRSDYGVDKIRHILQAQENPHQKIQAPHHT